MKKYALFLIFFICQCGLSFAQSDAVTILTKKTCMIPTRDGVKLHTVVLSPGDAHQPAPILMQRTPYGAYTPADSIRVNLLPPAYQKLAQAGYILVFQDIRGKFRSEGTFEMCRPLYHLEDKSRTDESTDTWDTVEWLRKNIANNNGKVGIFGVSYPGYMALDAAVDPHPALKASSPQAPIVDMFLGDDFHHNGAFRLSYGFEYSYYVEHAKGGNSPFPFPQFDLYNWYLKLGSLKNVNEKYFKNQIPTWTNFTRHPNYDAFWERQSSLRNIQVPEIPILFVGGYFDQEDLNGCQVMYTHLEKRDILNRNFILLGPWSHGQWARIKADSLGRIAFGSNTGEWFKDFQLKWFDYWLKGKGAGDFPEAACFQTGTNQWKSYPVWPPKNTERKKLYTYTDHTTGFREPSANKGSVSYVSDPAKPVPYRQLPIEATMSKITHWDAWQVDDQRFVSTRPDVATFTGDSLKENFTVTGNITAHLFASTTGSDADFIVKLIDVYPDQDRKNLLMSGYQLPVAMEVFRGRFRKGFDKPEPLPSNKPLEFVIDLHQINHTFLKGHRLMIQIQSTWFPVIDRNPQKYVSNIFEAEEKDFIRATHRIYCNSQYPTYIELPVMKQ